MVGRPGRSRKIYPGGIVGLNSAETTELENAVPDLMFSEAHESDYSCMRAEVASQVRI